MYLPFKIFQPNFLFNENNRAIVERHTDSKFVLDIDPGDGQYRSLFYSANPDKSKGHGHYFFARPYDKSVMLSACPLEFIEGVLEDGVFYYSSYLHDYAVTPRGQSIDGGVYCTRSNGKTVTMFLGPEGPRIERNGDEPNENREEPESRLPSGEAPA